MKPEIENILSNINSHGVISGRYMYIDSTADYDHLYRDNALPYQEQQEHFGKLCYRNQLLTVNRTDDAEELSQQQYDLFLFNKGQSLLKENKAGRLNEVSLILNYYTGRSDNTSKKYLIDLLKALKLNLDACGLFHPPAFSHGGSSIRLEKSEGIIALTLAIMKAQSRQDVPQLFNKEIKAVTKWIISFFKDADFSSSNYSLFPFEVETDTKTPTFNNQLCWNRGDSLIAILLYESSRALEDKSLFEVAELVGLNTLIRKDFASTEINNSSILTGSTGIAESYKYMFELSANEKYLSGYRYWIEKTIQYLPRELETNFYVHKNSFYLGLSGVSLSLLAYLEENKYSATIRSILF